LFFSLKRTQGFAHFDVCVVSASCVQVSWRTHTPVRATVDLLSTQQQHVRVRFDAACKLPQFEVRRATPHRLMRELLAAVRRDVPEFPQIENVFEIDFDLLQREIVPLSSPLERSMLCGALVRD
jgi:hypothetical protein